MVVSGYTYMRVRMCSNGCTLNAYMYVSALCMYGCIRLEKERESESWRQSD